MNKLSGYGLAIAFCIGTTGLLASSGNRTAPESQSVEAQLATDGAFRDGLYVGKLAAQSGRTRHPLVGRWSTQRDRASFVAGYEQGYESKTQ